MLPGKEEKESNVLEREVNKTNIVKVASKPMMNYFFSIAIKFEYFTQVMVSFNIWHRPKVENIIQLYKPLGVEEISRKMDGSRCIVILERRP